MEISPDDEGARFHATVGDLEDLVEAPSPGDPEMSRIRVQLGGELAAREDSSALAAELEELVAELVAEADARRATDSSSEPRPDAVSVSVQGIGLDCDDIAVIKRRLLDHVRRRGVMEEGGGTTDERATGEETR